MIHKRTVEIIAVKYHKLRLGQELERFRNYCYCVKATADDMVFSFFFSQVNGRIIEILHLIIITCKLMTQIQVDITLE
jgi:hypothetical protein